MSPWNKASCKYEKWRELEPWEQRALIQFAIVIPLAWAGLRLAGFAWMQRLAHRGVNVQRHLPYDTNQYAQRSARLAALAARYCLPRGSCLPQSLTLCWLLRKEGLEATVRIGVKLPKGLLLAHAWVEYNNAPLGELEDDYHAFPHLHEGSGFYP